jgi:hypothetical protein
MQTLLQQSTLKPTHCRELVTRGPNYIRVKDASSHGGGGIIVGELLKCAPRVFHFTWLNDVSKAIVSQSNPAGTITNSDLEMAGLLMLFVIMEYVCGPLVEKQGELFSDNSPTIGWVDRLASRTSIIAAHLIRALALRLKANKCCPLMPQHISGSKNAMTDIPSRLFGSVPRWHFKTEQQLLTFFNDNFPLPQQKLWTVYHPSIELGMQVISILRMRHSTLADWWRLPPAGNHVGRIGLPMLQLWDWTLRYRESPLEQKVDSHRTCAESPGRILWTRDHSPRWNSMYSYHGHWTDDRHGPQRNPYQNVSFFLICNNALRAIENRIQSVKRSFQ